MSTAQIVAAVVVGWIVLAVIVGLIAGPIFKRNRKRYPKPPHVEPTIPEQRQGPKPRSRPQQWPFNGK